MKNTCLFIILLLLFSMSNYGRCTPDITNPTIAAPTNVVTDRNTACTATGVARSNPTTADNYTFTSVTNKQPSIVKENHDKKL